MNHPNNNTSRSTIVDCEAGYVLAMFLVLIAVGSLVVGGALSVNRVTELTNKASNIRSERFYEGEAAVNQVGAWLRENSEDMISVFGREEFYDNFVRGSYNNGSNDAGFITPTKLKLTGGADSVILSNHSSLGTSNFPQTADLDGNTFNPTSSFGSLSFGDVRVKVTLLDGIPKTLAKDTGTDPSETDYAPMFRVDAMRSTTEGAHVFAYYLGHLVTPVPLGFFGKTEINVNQECDSYDSEVGNYDATTNRNANCPIGSFGDVCIHQSEIVYGEVVSTGNIDGGSPCGGNVCADTSCSKSGDSCSGSSCTVDAEFPEYDSWAVGCPSPQVAQNYNSDQTVTAAPGANCWSSWSITNGTTVTLESTTTPYYVTSLTLNGSFDVVPDDPDGVVTLYVYEITGGQSQINGNSVVNSSATPAQFQMIYLGTSNVKLNGNADFEMLFIAPYAEVTLQGNADYHGGIIADRLNLTGNGKLHYDESLNNTAPTEISYKLQQVTQYYR